LSIFIGAVGFGICAAVTTTTLFAVAHKQAAHGVATMLISAHKIANTTISYYCTASLLHVDIHVRETMSWWLALARKKMWWWWIAPFGKTYNGDVLQLAKQLFSTRLPQMTKYCVMRECDNIPTLMDTISKC
jgi:hypothetical protein